MTQPYNRFGRSCLILFSAAVAACSDPTEPSGPTRHDNLGDQETPIRTSRCGPSGILHGVELARLPQGCVPVDKADSQ